MTHHSRKLKVIIQDDGSGFDVDEGLSRPDRFGPAGMGERAERLGGELRVEIDPGKGTLVTLTLAEEEAGQP